MKTAKIKKLSARMILYIQWEDRLETWFAGLFLHKYMSRMNEAGEDCFSSHSGNASSQQADREIMKRPCKEPFSFEKSLSIIRKGRGSSFDPDVVDVFFTGQHETFSVKKQYDDDDQHISSAVVPRIKSCLVSMRPSLS